MRVRTVIIIVFVCLHQGYGLHNEALVTSDGACFGSVGPIFVNMTCPAGTVVSVQNIYVGAKDVSTGCPPVYDNTTIDTSCCAVSNSNDECVYLFDHSNYDNYHRICNGRNNCNPQMFNSLIQSAQCPAGFQGVSTTTTFGYTQYKCLDDSNIVEMCTAVSLNTTGDSVYIASDNFPETIRASVTSCSCSVEANDPTSTLAVVTIHRFLEGNNSTECNQFLSLVDSGLTTLATWTCSDNTQVEAILSTTSNYLIFEFSNNITSDDGFYWFEIRASNSASTLHVNCPAIYPQTTSTSSTNPTTTTTASTVTTSTTPSTSVTTPTTTTTPVQTDSPQDAASTSEDNGYLLIVIIVSAIAGLLLLILIVVICICCLQRRGRDKDQPSVDRGPSEKPNPEQPTSIREVHEHPPDESVVVNMPHTFSSPSPDLVEPINLDTCEAETNTESVEIERTDQYTQVLIPMVDQECSVLLTAETKSAETNTDDVSGKSMNDVAIQTEKIKKIRTKPKKKGTDDISKQEIQQDDKVEHDNAATSGVSYTGSIDPVAETPGEITADSEQKERNASETDRKINLNEGMSIETSNVDTILSNKHSDDYTADNNDLKSTNDDVDADYNSYKTEQTSHGHDNDTDVKQDNKCSEPLVQNINRIYVKPCNNDDDDVGREAEKHNESRKSIESNDYPSTPATFHSNTENNTISNESHSTISNANSTICSTASHNDVDPMTDTAGSKQKKNVVLKRIFGAPNSEDNDIIGSNEGRPEILKRKMMIAFFTPEKKDIKFDQKLKEMKKLKGSHKKKHERKKKKKENKDNDSKIKSGSKLNGTDSGIETESVSSIPGAIAPN